MKENVYASVDVHVFFVEYEFQWDDRLKNTRLKEVVYRKPIRMVDYSMQLYIGSCMDLKAVMQWNSLTGVRN